MRRALVFLVMLAGAMAAASTLSGQQPAPDTGKANFERLCGTCHEPERSTSSRRTREQWLQTVNSMVARGAEGTDAELMAVIDYLTREHGRVNVNLAGADDIALVLGVPPADAAAIVEYRRQHGTFENADAVARVPGVDTTRLAARRDAMVFGSRVASNAGRVPVSALTAANNWPSVNGGPQRQGWARPEAMLARSTVGAVKLLYTRKLDNQNRGTRALTPPLVLGNLISYRGFKEMLFLGGSSDTVYSIDAVLNRVLWTTKLPVRRDAAAGGTSASCAGGLMGIVMTGTAASGFGAAPGIRRPGSTPSRAGAPQTPRSALVTGLAGGFGRNGLLVAVGSDGQVHPLYQSNGTPFENPIPFLPPNASVRGVNLFDNTLYAATTEACGGQKEAVYALDLASEDKTVRRFDTSAGAQGSAGPAVGNDGTVYAHTAGRIVALTEKELKEKDHFAMAAAADLGTTPLVFEHNDKDLVVAGAGGDIYVLDSAALGGKDHRTPLARARVEGTVRGALASWEDPETGVRWIFAPVWGDGDPAGAIAAFTYEDGNGRAALTERWMARGIAAPAAPAIANGLVFALATGDNPRLYILDAASGKQLFTSRDQVAGAAGAETGLAVANGRVYFSTLDNVVYCFGIPTEH